MILKILSAQSLLVLMLYWLHTDITNHHKLTYSNRNRASHSAGGQISETKVQEGHVLSEGSWGESLFASFNFWWLQTFLGLLLHNPNFFLCFWMTFSICLCLLFFSSKDDCHSIQSLQIIQDDLISQSLIKSIRSVLQLK